MVTLRGLKIPDGINRGTAGGELVREKRTEATVRGSAIDKNWIDRLPDGGTGSLYFRHDPNELIKAGDGTHQYTRQNQPRRRAQLTVQGPTDHQHDHNGQDQRGDRAVDQAALADHIFFFLIRH
jgi:hypothetical protein